GGCADRINPAVLLDEAEARLAQLVDLVLLLGCELAPDGDESLALLQFLEQLASVDVGEDACHLLNQLITIDDLGGIGIEGRAFDVSGKEPPVAVEDVGSVHGGGNIME